MKTICLNMIVREENSVIQPCLDSVKELIDYWVIIDTGSNDGTQQTILKCLKNIPGKLLEQTWVDFAYHRNQALEHSKNKSDYLLFLDADERLILPTPLPFLEKDCYFIRMVGQWMEFHKFFLIKNNTHWKWEGVLHEYLLPEAPTTSEILITAHIEYNLNAGYRSRNPNKALQDIEILQQALIKEPENGRYTFYLAQSYLQANDISLSLKYFEKRVQLHKNDQTSAEKEEVFWSLYHIGCLSHDIIKPFEEVVKAFSQAFHYDPARAEPLYFLARVLQEKKFFFLGYLVNQFAFNFPERIIRVQQWIYDYGITLQYAKCSQKIGKIKQAQQLYQQLLNNPKTPETIKQTVYENYLP